MILPGIWTCHVAKEAERSCFNDTWNWRAAGPTLKADNCRHSKKTADTDSVCRHY